MKTISVVMATYNGAAFIKEQLLSIVQQSRRPDEIVIFDDASVDETYSLAQSILSSYSIRFKLERNEQNMGHLKTFERACRACAGNYIAFCDQDDIWMPNKLADLLQSISYIEKKNDECPCMVFSDMRVVDKGGTVICNSYNRLQKLNPDKTVKSLRALCVQNVATGMTMLINRALLEKALPFPDSAMTHDWWIVLVCKAFGRIIYNPLQLCDYRQHESNVYGAKLYDDVAWWKNLHARKKQRLSIKQYLFHDLNYELYQVYRPHLVRRADQILALISRGEVKRHKLNKLAIQLKKGGLFAVIWCVIYGALPPSIERKLFFCRSLLRRYITTGG